MSTGPRWRRYPGSRFTRPFTSFGVSNWILQTYNKFELRFKFESLNLGVKWVFLEVEDTGKCILKDPCVYDWIFCSTVVSHLMISSALKDKIKKKEWKSYFY